jgi:hypothetical protein
MKGGFVISEPYAVTHDPSQPFMIQPGVPYPQPEPILGTVRGPIPHPTGTVKITYIVVENFSYGYVPTIGEGDLWVQANASFYQSQLPFTKTWAEPFLLTMVQAPLSFVRMTSSPAWT